MKKTSVHLRLAGRRRSWLLFSLLLVLISLSGAYGLGVYSTLKGQMETETLAAQQAQAEMGALFITDFQQRLLDRLTSVAARPGFQEAILNRDPRPMRAELRNLIARTDVDQTYVLLPDGQEFYLLPEVAPQQRLNHAQAEWFKAVLAEKQPRFSRLQPESRPDRAPGITVGVPILGASGETIGVLAVHQRLNPWTSIFSRLADLAGRTFYLFDQAGNLVAGDLEAVEDADQVGHLARRLLAESPQREGVVGRVVPDPGSDDLLFLSAKVVPVVNWVFVVAREYPAAMAPMRAMFGNLMIFLILLLVCILALALLLVSRYRLQQLALARVDEEARRLEAEVAARTADLRRSTERYRSLVEDLPDVVFEADSSGRLTFVSQAVVSILGYRPEEMLGRPWRDFLLPEDQPLFDRGLARGRAPFPDLGAGLDHSPASVLAGDRESGIAAGGRAPFPGHDAGLDHSPAPALVADRESGLAARGRAPFPDLGAGLDHSPAPALAGDRESGLAAGGRALLSDSGADADQTTASAVAADRESGIAAGGRAPLPDSGADADQTAASALAAFRGGGLSAGPTPLRHLSRAGRIRWLSLHSRELVDAQGWLVGRRGVVRDVSREWLAEQRVHELSRQLFAAQEEERKRVALDLHDEMGPLLGAIKLGLQGLARQPGQAAWTEAERLIDLSQKVMDRIRTLGYTLRPALLDSLGLVAALRDLAESVAESSPVIVRLDLAPLDETRLTPEQKTTLFRFAQEGLTNAVRHSDSATVAISLKNDGPSLTLSVADQGRGFDVEQALPQALARKQLGLMGMAERLRLAGGRLEIVSGPAGTTLTGILPLEADGGN